MSRPPRIPNWLPWEQSTIYFMTLCVKAHRPVLANAETWTICRVTLDRLNEWTILSALAMPDHIHLLCTPKNRDASVSAFAKWFKRWFNAAYHFRASVSDGKQYEWKWQEGCFDRLLRSDESLSSKWAYIRQNPVRARLVADAEDWPYQFQFDGSMVNHGP